MGQEGKKLSGYMTIQMDDWLQMSNILMVLAWFVTLRSYRARKTASGLPEHLCPQRSPCVEVNTVRLVSRSLFQAERGKAETNALTINVV